MKSAQIDFTTLKGDSMPIAYQMFNPALVASYDRAAEFDRSESEATPAYAAYLALGAMRQPLSDKESNDFGGECFFVAWVVGHVPLIQAVVKTAYDNDIEFPGVFLYEVVEPFGAWLRTVGSIAFNDRDTKAELARLAVEFFYPASTDDTRRHFAGMLYDDLGILEE